MSRRQTDMPALAIIFMIIAVAMLVGMNTLVKLIGPDYHAFQVTFLRNLVAAFVLTPFIMKEGGLAALCTRRPGLHLLRSISGLTGVCCFFYAVQRLSVGEVMVISQAVPLFVTALAVPVLAEKVGWHGFMPYTDRVDYVAAMTANQGWAMAAEALGDIEVPKRGEYCRVIAAELGRICSHLLAIGATGMDIGAVTPFTHALREREMINDLMEELCGARLTFNYLRIGGVAWDLPPGYREKVLTYLDHFEPAVHGSILAAVLHPFDGYRDRVVSVALDGELGVGRAGR